MEVDKLILAQIIVDVPTMQTDIPYTYMVPESLSSSVQKGMRVAVPFGKGNRTVQGIICDLDFHGQWDSDSQLKTVQSILDLSPVLNDELLNLSKWMAKTTYSFQISCMLTMLPSVMRAKYQKQLVLHDTLNIDTDVLSLFNQSNVVTIDLKQLPTGLVSKITNLKRQGKLDVIYKVNNNAVAKKVYAIAANISVDKAQHILSSMSKRAINLIKILQYIISHAEDTILQRELVQKYQISESSIKNAIEKGWLKRFLKEEYRNPYKQNIQPNHPSSLNIDQEKAVHQIKNAIDSSDNRTFLLEGVTGSGKTEVYLHSIQHALSQNKTALMLVPEIALTPQMVRRVKGRFGDRVAVLHSGLSAGEKYDEWRRIYHGKADVVVGARSAVFAPLKNIGMIIMDEEHESSYKQDDAPRYHTRNVALWRAKYYHCPLVLGSATPSLESRSRAMKGVYTLLTLPTRINNQALPQVKVIDMRLQMQENGQEDFSNELLAAIQKCLLKKEQVVLMLNRRGYSSFVMCRSCGFVLRCPNCDISLTLHMDSKTMKCHYCGHEEQIPNRCRNCGSSKIRYYGTGTQKVQVKLQELLPQAKILRMDVDTTRRKGAHERILRQFGAGQANILLGTQMIAKGLDFPNVTLVGVLNADTSLDLPDFRSSERTFDLLTQVSGRAGRANKKGRVYIQTFNPDNYVIKLAQQQDYELFYRNEMKIRHETNYPPYYFTIKITASGNNERQAAIKIFEISKILKSQLSQQAITLGPTPSSIFKLKNKYYYQIIVKYKKEPKLDKCLEYILNHYQKDANKGLYINIDSNPLNFM